MRDTLSNVIGLVSRLAAHAIYLCLLSYLEHSFAALGLKLQCAFKQKNQLVLRHLNLLGGLKKGDDFAVN